MRHDNTEDPSEVTAIHIRQTGAHWIPATAEDRNALEALGVRSFPWTDVDGARFAAQRVGLECFLTGDASAPETDGAKKKPAKTKAPRKKFSKSSTFTVTPDKAKANYTTREEWLNAARDAMLPWFTAAGTPITDKVRLSCGWPSLGFRKCIGEAWHSSASADGTREVFVSPVLEKVIDGLQGVLETVCHELVHTALPPKTGHKAPFKRLAIAVGLTYAKKGHTGIDPAHLEKFDALARKLGAYPHAKLSPNSMRKKQSTRLIKCACPECDYTVRTTAKWLEIGLPRCPDHGDMERED